MLSNAFAAFPVLSLLLAVSAAMSADYRLEPLKEGPPEGVSAEIVPLLADSGVSVMRGESRGLCDIWLCKEIAVKEDFEPGPAVLYPLVPGELIGVIRYTNGGADFRDQDIEKGVYTIRYAQQPVDGAHIGTSPTRDFFLLIEASKDKSAKVLEYDPLVERSAEAAQSSHPALLSLQKAGEAKAPAIRHNEEQDWWIVQLSATTKGGGKSAKLPIEVVVVGAADE